MVVNLVNVDYVLLGLTLCSALIIGSFIIYIWTVEEQKKK